MATVVQTVAGSVNAAGSVSVTITSTGAGNLLLIGSYSTNTTVTLTPSTTGTAQTFTSIANPKTAGVGQMQAWYVPNCASGTTGITVTRNTGTGQASIVVMEVSGIVTSTPLDQSSSGTTVGDSSTTPTTTQASEFWWTLFGGMGLNDATQITFSNLLAGWTSGSQTTSTQTGANANCGLFDAYQIVAATGTAHATCTVTNAGAGGDGIAATFKLPLAGTAVKMQAMRGWSFPI